jgi:hypothetical protein
MTPHPGPLPGGEREMKLVAKSERTDCGERFGALVRDAMRCNAIRKRCIAFA